MKKLQICRKQFHDILHDLIPTLQQLQSQGTWFCHVICNTVLFTDTRSLYSQDEMRVQGILNLATFSMNVSWRNTCGQELLARPLGEWEINHSNSRQALFCFCTLHQSLQVSKDFFICLIRPQTFYVFLSPKIINLNIKHKTLNFIRDFITYRYGLPVKGSSSE